MAEQQRLQEAGYAPIHFSSLFPISQYIMVGQNLNGPAAAQVGRAKAAPVESLTQLRPVLNGSARLLILELEFFQAGHQNHISCAVTMFLFLRHSSIPLSTSCHELSSWSPAWLPTISSVGIIVRILRPCNGQLIGLRFLSKTAFGILSRQLTWKN